MKILVFGGDGYCGWPHAPHLSGAGHEAIVADGFIRRQIGHELITPKVQWRSSGNGKVGAGSRSGL